MFLYLSYTRLFIIFSILLFLSLVTYSPDDPNFIFSENIEIKNKLGIYGSYVSDFFFQSIGLISFIIPISIIMIGLNIFLNKKRLASKLAKRSVGILRGD